MRHVFSRLSWVVLIGILTGSCPAAFAALRAGAFAQDVTPETFPVIVNGNFTEVVATKANDRLHARALVMENGGTAIAIVVVDSCMLPRELLDEAKARAGRLTGIPADRMLISATHSHTAPSAMGCLGSDADVNYVKVLPDLLARAIAEAQRRLAPARIGHGVVYDAEHTAARRWVFRPDRVRNDPFGQPTVDAVREYAQPLKEAEVDTVILGCTHYPLIRPIFQRVLGRGVTLVFSAEETAREVAETLARKGIENDGGREGTYRFMTTGDTEVFRVTGARFLQLPIGEVEQVRLADLERAAA